MVQAILAFIAAAGATFYFSWVVLNDLAQSQLSHTRCAPNVGRQKQPRTFWFIVSLSGGLALLFGVLTLDAAYRIFTHFG